MTEDEAKTKWCPMVRFNDAGCNRDNQVKNGHNRPYYKCVASSCMMWRSSFTGEYGAAVVTTKAEEGHGWCGLAGKP